MRHKKLHFLLVYPLNTAPSQRFRFEQFFPLLKETGIYYTTESFYNASTFLNLYSRKKNLLLFFQICGCYLKRCWHMLFLGKYDCFFIQRGAAPLGPPIFEWVIKYIYRKPLIYDFDDAIWREPSKKGFNLKGILKAGGKVSAICKWAHIVVTGNHYLADYARRFNKNVVVIPTVIDTEDRFVPDGSSSNEIPVIGWTGSHTTLPYLESIEDVLLEIKSQHPFILSIIANKRPAFKRLDYKFIPWSEEIEVMELQKIDIGIMPLPNNEWTKGKCGFKAIQYMAVGKPTVASAVGVNIDIIEHGVNGYLCYLLDDWKKYLTLLVSNSSLRYHQGSAAREKARTKFSLRKAAADWCLVLRQV